MSVSALSNSSLNNSVQQYFQTRQKDLQGLGQQLASGNLAGAQAAFSTIANLGKNGPAASGNAFFDKNREQDFVAIGTALQAGDLQGAQQAFAQLKSTFQRQSGGGTGTSDPTQTEAPHPLIGPISASTAGPDVVLKLGASGANGAEGVLNLNGATGSTGPASAPSATSNANSGTTSSTVGPEIVINLNSGSSSSPEQVTLNLSSTSSGEQLSISVGNQGSTTTPELTLNLNANSNEQIVLNLLNGSVSSDASTAATTGSNLNVSA